MKNKNNRSLRLIASALAVFLFVICFMTACQPTPENAVVVGKDLEQMLELAAAAQPVGALTDRLDVPESYEASAANTQGSFRMVADAKIVLPDVKSIPIIRVEAQPFEQPVVDTLIDALFDEGQLYDPLVLCELTRDEISNEIARLQVRRMALTGQGLREPAVASATPVPGAVQVSEIEMTVEMTKSSVEIIDRMLSALYDQLAAAPEKKKLVNASGVLQTIDIAAGLPAEERGQYEGMRFDRVSVGQLCPRGGMRSLYVSNNQKSNAYSAVFINRGDYGTSAGHYHAEAAWYQRQDELANAEERLKIQETPEPKLTYAQAQKTADEFLRQIGVDGLVCVQCEKVIGGSEMYDAEGLRDGSLIKAYRLEYVREAAGVPLTYTNVQTTSDMADGMIWNWAYERMSIIVSDDGVVELKWDAPYRLVETVVESAALLPFPQIRNVFETMIIASNAPQVDTELHITEVRLGLMRISEQNNLSKGLLIPVWDFFGKLTTRYEEEGIQKVYTLEDAGQSWLTINAIDGSVIDRALGY